MAKVKVKVQVDVQPNDDRVLVKPLEESEQMRGGLYIPDTAKEKPSQGTVVAVGPGKISEYTGQRIAISLKVGDRVLYGKYSGTDYVLDGEVYLFIKASDVLGIIP